jgi:16S rRNA (guanine966-N2)-methyltransferase
MPVLPGARCLDLFAGSGALGFEALSRGAAAAVIVESNPGAVRGLRRSVEQLDATGAEVIAADAYRYLRTAGSRRFDIVFLDPPYADDSVGELCRLLAERCWLADGALVYFEQDRRQAPPALPAGWSVIREKTAGQVRYSLARVSPEAG